MFSKILIANRGEIACRVIKTAKRLGIKTVAVHSEADRDALHVELADEAVQIGPPPSRESYLVMDRIIEACKRTGAQAVHPGYGFLSENEVFARRIEEEGIVFIGPKHYSIAAMGDKIASKKLAIEAKVNTIPGHNAPVEAAEQAVEIARGIGYPVMIKASAGGGGKGLRVAFSDREAFDGYTSCRNEARSSFGDDRVFVEKYVEEPRHIEIQVLGDAHGNCVYLWERECSIQRRHQKVIEEAPSPFISEATRRAMGEQAVALAKAVNYQSAGTVEFVVGKDQSFYFLEMNTRLQVEHPVTECITGLDLVEQMLRVAAGEKLPFGQADIVRNGWAMECRINAEDPLRGFLPSTGRLVKFQPPRADIVAAGAPAATGVRVDTGVYEGGEIPVYYDSMIAKLIVHGTDRLDAIERMRNALNAFVIRGVSTNIAFQAALLNHPQFVAGQFNTGFIAQHYPSGFRGAEHGDDNTELLVCAAAAIHRRMRERAVRISGQLPGHEVKVPTHFVVRLGEAGHPVSVTPAAGGYTLACDGRTHNLTTDWQLRDSRFEAQLDGRPIVLQVDRVGLRYRLTHNGVTAEAQVLPPRGDELLRKMPVKSPPDLSAFLLSPMPGLLVELAVREGEEVKAGQRLAVIEAMKMENVLFAHADSVVEQLLASQGDSLAVDQPILRFAAAA
ncbi:MAG: acetyl/propionyl/methylcrotonyl-CoA carboxylase subunit alpha [Burkholderiales bacterium]|nr:acetyl/propionyl/methylcrotonyl-CoA carboxylase subunit alpha [Burkholderiales bacterium]